MANHETPYRLQMIFQGLWMVFDKETDTRIGYVAIQPSGRWEAVVMVGGTAINWGKHHTTKDEAADKVYTYR